MHVVLTGYNQQGQIVGQVGTVVSLLTELPELIRLLQANTYGTSRVTLDIHLEPREVSRPGKRSKK